MAAGSLKNKSCVWAFRECCAGALWAELLGCCRSGLCRWVKSVWVREKKYMQCFWYKSATAREDQWVHCSFDLAEVITSWRKSLEQWSSSVWSFWRKDNIPVYQWLMYFLMCERERQSVNLISSLLELLFLLNPFHCNSWGRRTLWFASAV